MGREARARGTHLGRAAEARGGEAGRGSRHVASPYFLQLSLNRGWGRRSEGPRKTFFRVTFGVAKLFVAGVAMAASCRKPECGEIRVQGYGPPGGINSLPLGRWERPPAPLSARAPRPLHRRRGPPLLPRPPGSAAAVPLASARRRGRRGRTKAVGRQVGRAPGGGLAATGEGVAGLPGAGAAGSQAGLGSAGRRPGGSLHQKGRVNTTLLHFPQVRGGWHFSGVQRTVRMGGSRVFCSFSFGTLGIDGSVWLSL